MQVLVVLLLLGFAGHFAGVLASFVLQYYDAGSRGIRTPSLANYAGAFLGEWWFSLAYLASFVLGYFPGRRLVPHQAGGGPPVVLVHGWVLNRASMFAFYWRLRRYGYQHVYTPTLEPGFGPMRETAENLAARLREISTQHQDEPVQVIAHNMGGVVMRKSLERDPDLPVAGVITVGTPHLGSGVANFGRSAAAHELRSGSTLLAELPAEPPVPFASVYSLVDNFVLPAQSAAFGDRRIPFSDVGHLTLLYSRRIFDAVLGELEAQQTMNRR